MEILTVAEVSEKLRCHPQTVYVLFNSGQLKGFRLSHGKKHSPVRIFASSLADFIGRNSNIEQERQAPTPAAANPTSFPETPPEPKKRRRTGRTQRLDDVILLRMA